LHGSNRLASTSLLEGLVFGWRAGEDAAHSPAPVPDRGLSNYRVTIPELASEEAWRRPRRAVWRAAGLVRTAHGLREGLAEIEGLEKEHRGTTLNRSLTVARTLVEGALYDGRSRGCHYRPDVQEEVALADLPG
jgi:L-aspartate oxidase